MDAAIIGCALLLDCSGAPALPAGGTAQDFLYAGNARGAVLKEWAPP
ncbi:hypothetical protein [Paraburkholderia caballeronis]|nr:hypothetical protein [Paraburkholderia caballeronis]